MSKKNIHEAMGSLAYAIAMADGEVQEEEKHTIMKLAQQEFELSDQDNEWIANMFVNLETKNIELDDAYNYAIDVLEANRFEYDFDESMKKKCLGFMQKVADAFGGIDNEERSVINKFKKDLEKF